MIRRAPLLLALGLAWAGPASGASVSEAPDRVSVTIYRAGPANTAALRDARPDEGLALVTETRTIDLPAGRSVVTFRGVADRIVPQTAAVEGMAAELLERNTDYDLLSPASLLAKSVGRTVRLVRTDRASGKVVETAAVVRAAPSGVVLETEHGIEALGCANLPERIVVDGLPRGLAERATLSMAVEAKSAGPRKVRLSYLTTGLSWSADYVATLSDDGRSLDLHGWITLANMSETRFGDAPTQVVAGDLSRDDDTRPIEPSRNVVSKACWAEPRPPQPAPPMPMPAPMALGRMADSGIEEIVVSAARVRESDLGDYKLYTLPEPTTVAARQIKQVAFLSQPKAAVRRLYEFKTTISDIGEDQDDSPRVVLRLDNKREAGLGRPLPAGVVAVMEKGPDGRLVLAGEHQLDDDVPVGLTRDLTIGQAMDVSVRPTLLSETERGERTRYEIEVEAVNAKDQAILLEYRHQPQGVGFKVKGGRRPSETKAGAPLWALSMPARSRQVFRYVVEEDD